MNHNPSEIESKETNKKQYIPADGAISLTCDAFGDANTAIVWKFHDGTNEEVVTGTPTQYVPADYKISSTYEVAKVVVADHDGTYSCAISSDATLKDSVVIDAYSKYLCHL